MNPREPIHDDSQRRDSWWIIRNVGSLQKSQKLGPEYRTRNSSRNNPTMNINGIALNYWNGFFFLWRDKSSCVIPDWIYSPDLALNIQCFSDLANGRLIPTLQIIFFTKISAFQRYLLLSIVFRAIKCFITKLRCIKYSPFSK